MTIDGLAVIVKNGFDGMTENFNMRFKSVEGRLDKVEGRLDKIAMKLDSLERRIFAIENILTEHGKDIGEIKSEIKKIRKSGSTDHEKILELEQRVKVLENKVG